MKIRDLLKATTHRPWDLPEGKWKYYQEWNNAVFLHWKVDIADLRKFVPEDLEIDLFEGRPWVSLVAFTMNRIRPRNLPAFAAISDFHEVNIRTYVRKKAKTGAYFLSIEGGNTLSCKIARIVSKLPYRYSRITRQENKYHSANKSFSDELLIHYNVGRHITEKNSLDKWLTERYALYQDTPTSIHQFEVHHIEWPIHELSLHQLRVKYPRFEELLSNSPDCVQFSPGVQVLAWDKTSESR